MCRPAGSSQAVGDEERGLCDEIRPPRNSDAETGESGDLSVTPARTGSFLPAHNPASRVGRMVSRWDARIDLIPPDVAADTKQHQPEDASRPEKESGGKQSTRPAMKPGGCVVGFCGHRMVTREGVDGARADVREPQKRSQSRGGSSASNGNGPLISPVQRMRRFPRGIRLRGGRSAGGSTGRPERQRRSAGGKRNGMSRRKGFMGCWMWVGRHGVVFGW